MPYALKSLGLDYEYERGRRRATTIVSIHDYSTWEVGEWREASGELEPCYNGFHCFRGTGMQQWVNWGDVLAIVQTGKEVVASNKGRADEKFVYRKMRIVTVVRLTKKFLRKFCKDNNLDTDVLDWYARGDSLTSALADIVPYSNPIIGKRLYKAIMDEYMPKEEES